MRPLGLPKAKLRVAGRAARAAYWDRFAFSVEVTWPPGILGCLCGALLILTPPLIVALAVWIGRRGMRGAGWWSKRSTAPR